MNIEFLDIQNPKWGLILEQIHHDVYHLPEYLVLEANRIGAQPRALLVQNHDQIFFMPFLQRTCDDLFPNENKCKNIYDAVSPYGYSGIILSLQAKQDHRFIHDAICALNDLFQQHNICSLFVRNHPILSHDFQSIFPENTLTLSGEIVAIDLLRSDADYWQDLRREHRLKIDRCKKAGFEVEFTSPCQSEYLDEFVDIYYETMNRVKADSIYFFDRDYFDALVNLKDYVHLGIVKVANQVVCGELVFDGFQMGHFHLSGTRSDFMDYSPSILLKDATRHWMKARQNKWLNLGGGVGASKDSLYQFKAGFSKKRHPFWTMRMITHPELYQQLVANTEKLMDQQIKTQFFPAYRAFV